MKVHETELPGVLVIEPDVFGDARGWFAETWREERYRELGIREPFVQDNLSQSRRGVLRGLHLQCPLEQGKLAFVIQGEVFDVAVDLRRGSPHFGRWFGITLSGGTRQQLWLPPGFAHGFCVLSDETLFAYKCTARYEPSAELTVRWDDPELGIAWPLPDPVLSPRDAEAPRLRDIDPARLPRYRSD